MNGRKSRKVDMAFLFGNQTPSMIVECKRANISLNDKHFRQLNEYAIDLSSVKVGVWTAKNPMNGNVITTNAYHSFEFNAKGQIHEMRDYFDASGAMAAAMKGAE